MAAFRLQRLDLDALPRRILQAQPCHLVRRRLRDVHDRGIRQAHPVEIGPDQRVADAGFPSRRSAVNGMKTDLGAGAHEARQAAEPRQCAGRRALRTVGHQRREVLRTDHFADLETCDDAAAIAVELHHPPRVGAYLHFHGSDVFGDERSGDDHARGAVALDNADCRCRAEPRRKHHRHEREKTAEPHAHTLPEDDYRQSRRRSGRT